MTELERECMDLLSEQMRRHYDPKYPDFVEQYMRLMIDQTLEQCLLVEAAFEQEGESNE